MPSSSKEAWPPAAAYLESFLVGEGGPVESSDAHSTVAKSRECTITNGASGYVRHDDGEWGELGEKRRYWSGETQSNSR